MADAKELSIAVLDDYGDLATVHFSKIPNLRIEAFPETVDTNEELQRQVDRLRSFPIISTMRERTAFPSALLSKLPNLKLLLTTGTRNAAIDLVTAERHGIAVYGSGGSNGLLQLSNKPSGPSSTAQHTVALILALASNIAADDYIVKRGGWQTSYLTKIGGQMLGLLGLGRLGSAVGKIMAESFGMKVIAWSPNLTQERADAQASAVGLPPGSFRVVSKNALFEQADVLSLHLVLSDRTADIVGAEELGRMKATAVLVNTSRGPLINEPALHEVLLQGSIRGCAMDVFWKEPLADDSPWRTTNWGTSGSAQVILSPHMGYVNEPEMNLWYEEQAENVQRWIKGEAMTSKVDNSSYA